MKYLKSLLFLLMMVSLKTNAQPGFVGFDTTICGSPMTDSYSFSNWSSGMGSGTVYGFTIYRNGSPVYSMSGSMSGSVYGSELIFINDSTGFMAYRVAGYGHQLKKTNDYGANWTLIGNGAPYYFGTYILNANYAYMVTWYSTSLFVMVTKCSDISPSSNLIFDDSLSSDIYTTDTIYGDPLCNRDSLRIFISNAGDTITYHINYVSLTPTAIDNHDEMMNMQIGVYPNPADYFFKLSDLQKPVTAVRVYALNGTMINNYNFSHINQNHFPLEGIPTGLYQLEIETSDARYIKKLVLSR